MTYADGGTLEQHCAVVFSTFCCSKTFEPTYFPEPERLEIGMNLQVDSNVAASFPSPRVPSFGTLAKGSKAAPSEASMNYARKWHEAGSKRVESMLENGTNQARKWHKPGSRVARTRLENGTN